MALNLTRINNNQITTASGNAADGTGIDASTKIQPYSITATKLANNLTYGNNLTVTGNLTVNGTTTAINTTYTQIADPIIQLADGQTTGVPTVDIGFIGLRGAQDNAAFIWNEANGEFATALTSTTDSNTVVTIGSYANLHTGNQVVTGNLSVTGQATLSNVSNVTVVGNVVGGNLIANTNVIGGNINANGSLNGANLSLSGNVISPLNVTGDVIANNVTAVSTLSSQGNIISVGNISGANVNTSNLSLSGNVTSALNVDANISVAAGSFYLGDGGYLSNINAANVAVQKIYNGTSYANVSTSNGNVDIGVNSAQVGTFFSGGLDLGAGNVVTTGALNAANLSLTGNVISTLNVTTDVVANNLSATSNVVSSGNINTATGALNAQSLSLSGNVTSQLDVTANVLANNLNAVTSISTAGNVIGQNVRVTTLLNQQIAFAGTDGTLLGNSNIYTDGANVTLAGGNLAVAGDVTVTGTTANISTTGNVIASGRISATGNVYGNNISATGDIYSGANATVTGNVVANTLTGSSVLVYSSSGGLNLNTNGSGNINVNSTYINNLTTPVAASDAANKEYVDAIASGLDLKASTVVGTVQPLDAEAEVTNVVYFNGTAGVGATLTITTTTQLIVDGVDISTIGTGATARVLIKDELLAATATSDAAWNGIYVVTSSSALSTVLTRSTDFDDEGALGSMPGAFTFIEQGTGQADTGWVCTTNNPIVVGTTPINWAQFSGAGQYQGGNAIAINGTVITTVYDNSTIGVNGSNQLYIPANAPLVTPNIGAATGTSLSVSGNVTGTYVIATTDLSAQGNVVTTGSLNTANLSLTGNVISTLNITGNTYSNNIHSTVDVTSGANINAATGTVNAQTLSLSGNVISDLTVTANVLANNINAVNVVSAAGNIIGANFTTTGSQGNITGANIISGITLSATGNITTSGGFFNGDGGFISNINAANVATTKITNGGSYANVTTSDGNVVIGVGSASNVAATFFDGGAQVANLSVVGNVVGALNVTTDVTANNVTAVANVLAGNVNATSLSLSGNVISTLNVTTDATANNVTAVANVSAGNVNSVSLSLSGNVISDLNVTANATANNVTAVTGVSGLTGTFGNITIANATINTNLSPLTVNSASGAFDFAVNGTAANVFYVNGTSNTASFGSNAQVANALVAFNSVSSIVLPVGNTAQRPGGTPTTGMLRFNTSLNSVEVYNNSQWETVGATTFTVIQDESFTGDGATVNFTLGSTQTTNSCIVSINGVVQAPTSAYSVAGTFPTCVLTFTEAPAIGDNIDVRELTTTSSVISISSGNVNLYANSAAGIEVTGGNLSVGPGFYFKGDGSQLTNLSGNINVAYITSGTSNVAIPTPGANVTFKVANTANALVVGATSTVIAGDFLPAANVTYNLGSNTAQWNELHVAGNTIYLGDQTLSISGGNLAYNSNTIVTANPTGTSTTAGNVAITGNVSGGNIKTVGFVSATGNVTGNYIFGNGALLTGVITSVANINLGTSNVTVTSSGGNISVGVGGTPDVVVTATTGQYVTGVVSATGAITGASLNISTGAATLGSIVNANANGVGNIGSAGTYFDTVFAKATSAVYADLAEKYTADAEYEPGTVVSFGGDAEVTASTSDADRRVAGVVSTNPSYIMNAGLEGTVALVALTGRVPTKVTGTVRKGDLMVSNGDGTARAEADPKAGSVIGKALENFDGATGTIEVVVGRL